MNEDSKTLIAVTERLVAVAKVALEERQRSMPYVGVNARRRKTRRLWRQSFALGPR